MPNAWESAPLVNDKKPAWMSAPVVETSKAQSQEKPDLFAGLPEETKQSILTRYPDVPESTLKTQDPFGDAFNAGFTGGFDQTKKTEELRRRAANLERIRLDNPYLAELIEGLSPGKAALIGAGKKTEDYGQGLGRLIGILDAEDARDTPEYQALRSVRPEAATGELATEVATMAIPGAKAQSISRFAPRVATTGALEATAAGLSTAGEGGTAEEIATAAGMAGTVGPVIGEVVGAAFRARPGRAGAATEQPRPPTGDVDEIPVEEISITQLPKESAKKAEIRQAIENGDRLGARFRLDDQGRVVKDEVAGQVINQGFDEGVVATIKHSSAADRQAMRRMLDRAERALSNRTEGARNRPSDIIGESVMSRWEAVRRANRQAGQDIKKAVQKIARQRVDVTDVVDSFADDLDELGVGQEMTKNGFKPDFKGSQIEGNSAAAAIRRVYDRLKNEDSVVNLQGLKQYIDNQINWNKSPDKPLDAKAVTVLKKLREGINQKLRGLSDEYADANDRFSETVGALNSVSDVLGRRFDPESEGVNALVGQEMRKVLSNYAKRDPLTRAIDALDAIAAKYGATFNDDPIHQVVFFNDLERLFGSFAPNSLQGVTEKAAERATKSIAKGNVKEGVIDAAVDAGYNKLRGRSEQNAIRYMRELLTEG